ncbi:MAG: ATP-binding protein, partial [Oligoflexales bacterium]|nr:ATP-binding protein [Oligoflexales bacterium]
HESLIDGDRQKLSRVFLNIISNAFQAVEDESRLWFTTKENITDGVIEFCIGNSGSYIDEKSLPHLFDEFFSSKKPGGTGLGLAISRKLIVDHGGRIWCESSKAKRRVEFYFTIPVALGHKTCFSGKLPEVSLDLLKPGDQSFALAENDD